ncbi:MULTISPECIES: D-arabinono-1,4-lactone oxidase [unclassified Crossiella]|uniref:D-arabinono-1,4-lactone oxidase n=1 Tax=unclassified Crossiella TaxID=2620835 RepID=UPI001FFF8BCE|nr:MULTISPECIES: D-arabinono-1,4-lactone oxidase [unclassified Crossiella]MCK2245145.1 FAD-binding protein [Crossiella sp. S99.2]MCK2258798.1 FAD-binding protein [Crossiella sp. S99.1]
MPRQSDTGSWTNWARTATARPARTARPRDVEEIAAAVKAAARDDLTVRPLGSGHSFSAVGSPEGGLALDLSDWRGVIAADHQTGLVTVRAGTPLHQLNHELDQLGLAMTNLGDIDRQTVAGAISTGTHGTGASFGGLATQVQALELVLADGSLLRCSATENPAEFSAAKVGLGALGVLTTVTLRCEPAFALQAAEYPAGLDETIECFDELTAANDHAEFHWFVHTDRVMVKRNNRLPVDAPRQPLHPVRRFFEYEVLENAALAAVCHTGRAIPSLVRPLNRLCAKVLGERSYSDASHRVFTTPRRVRFTETEYAIPREHLREVLTELRAASERLEHPVNIPVEVRVAAADDIWLSTATGRPTAYLAIHQFLGMPYRHWFDTFEQIAYAAGGRPHWGKMHSQTEDSLRGRYPRFADFQAVRAALDPHGRFRNRYLDRVLGTTN